jgi:thiol-disulfide isomerase/thioredoxin
MAKKPHPFLWGCCTGVLLTLIVTVGATLAGTLLFKNVFVGMKAKQLRPPPIVVDEQTNYVWSMEDLEGVPFDFASTKGKAVFLHIWHPDCITCLSEIPSLNRLHEKMAENTRFVSVTWCGAEELQQTVEKWDIQYPVYRTDKGRPQPFEGKSLPATFIIDPEGTLRFKHIGGSQWDHDSVLALLNKLSHPAP